MVQLAHQTEVSNLYFFTMPNKNVPCCQIPVNKAFFRKVALRKKTNRPVVKNGLEVKRPVKATS